MLSRVAVSINPLSMANSEPVSGSDSITLVVSLTDSGAITILGSDSITLTVSSSDTGLITVTGSDAVTLTVSGTDESQLVHGYDNGTLEISATDSGWITSVGQDAITLTVDFSEGQQVLTGSDSVTLTVSASDTGHIVASGSDAVTLTITATDSGTVTITGTNVTVIMNVTSGGHGLYSNYTFNSFFRLNGKYYGCSDAGIVELAGDTDSGTDIDATAVSGVIDFGVNTFFHDAYLLLRSEGEMQLGTKVEEVYRPAPYSVPFDRNSGMQRRRIKLARGLKGNTWQFDLANVDGADFTAKQLEAMPVQSGRRI